MQTKLFTERFLEIADKGLPGENAHAKMMPANRPFTSDALRLKPEYRQSAVGILLYPFEDTINSVLIQRPDYQGTHGNQISFPGGKRDPEDENLIYTARRECFEEVNLPMNIGEHIGKLSNVYIPVSNFLVEPHLFVLDETPILSPDQREVANIIHFDLFELQNPSIERKVDMRFKDGFTRKNIPYFDINGHVVWGATGMMLAEIKEVLNTFK